MSDMPPPDDLFKWTKKELADEVKRLRAIMREHAEQVGAAHSGGGLVAIGDGEGESLIDARGAVLLERTDAVLVDTKGDEPVAVMLKLAGRVNYSTDHADTAYFLSADAAAGIVWTLVGLVRACKAGGLEHGHRFAEAFEQGMAARGTR